MPFLLRAILVLGVLAAPAWGQIWDRSGNNKLSGDYFFRHVAWGMDTFGDLTGAFASYGMITFDGQGNYSVNGAYFEGRQLVYAPTGTYSLGASGYGFLEHPRFDGVRLLVLVSNGVIIGSSPDQPLNDFFMAVPLGPATAATFNGNYSMAYMNFPVPPGAVEFHYDALAKFAANGSGGVGNVSVRAYEARQGATPINLTESGVTYLFQNGVGRMNFPVGQGLAIQGFQMLGISPDGNLIFGGSPGAFDFFVGVRRAAGSTSAFEGLYYLGGFNLDASSSNLSQTGGEFDTYLGSLQARDGVNVGHQRLRSPRGEDARNFTYSSDFPAAPGEEYTDSASSTMYAFSADGGIRIGLGVGPYLGISVAVRAPDLTGTGVYLSPVGVLNAASFAPFTAGVARGELLTLFGAGLADQLVVAGSVPFPTSLGGVEVLINGNLRAPIYYVSPDQVSVIVPYGLRDEIAQIQVVRNGTTSNAVTAFVYDAAPGVFTVPPRGTGYGAVLHLDYSLVTPENPARPGEYLAIFLTGLGEVFPTVQDGAVGPTGQLAETVNTVSVRIGGKVATQTFAGLAPGLAGLYQVNAQVPDDVPEGDVYLDIAVGDGYTSQVLLPVGASAASPATDPRGLKRAVETPVRRR